MELLNDKRANTGTALLAVTLAVIFVSLCFASSWNDSPAFDEPEHAVSGYCYVETREFWSNPFHPPLTKVLAGLGLKAIKPIPPSEAWQARQKQYSIDLFFFESGNDPQQLIRAARAPLILAYGLLTVGFFFMLRRDTDPQTALVATAMLALCPNFLAHTPRVTSDVGAAFAAFAVLWSFHRYCQDGGWWKAVFGLTLGVALLVKFSMLLLLALLPAILLLEGRQQRILDALQAAGLALVAVWGAYAFWAVPPEYQIWYNQYVLGNQQGLLIELVRATEGVPGLRYLSWYGSGVSGQFEQFTGGNTIPVLFLEQSHFGGRRSYFPILFVTKVPVGYLLLFLLGAYGCWRQPPPRPLRLYGAFILVFFTFAWLGNLNLGIRHILPIFPCVFALAAWGVTRVTGRLPRTLAALAFLWVVSSVGGAYPGYLAYYNELVGGKTGGKRIALDSNFDWGVDLYRLALWAQERPEEPIYTLYFGRIRPLGYLGEQARPLPEERPTKGWLAISEHYYRQLLLAQNSLTPNPMGLSRETAAWIAACEMTERLGDSILLCDLSDPLKPAGPDAELEGLP